MVVKVSRDFDNRETFKRGMDKNVIFNIYCFLCGFVVAMMIAVAMFL